MKKLAAILLLALFAFNMMGYQLLYQYLANKSDHRLESSFDEAGYNEADLILIKQPHTLPYFTDSKEFQRIDGEVNVNGVVYKYVKYRIYGGFVEMLCLPHHQKMQIEQQKNKLAADGSEYASAAEKKADKTLKNLKTPVWEFEDVAMSANMYHPIVPCFFISNTLQNWSNASRLSPEQPPELA
jgi:hypothetical protein